MFAAWERAISSGFGAARARPANPVRENRLTEAPDAANSEEAPVRPLIRYCCLNVVDLWGGYRDGQTRAEWREDAVVLMFSRAHKCQLLARYRAEILHSGTWIRHPAVVASAVQAHEELLTHLVRTSPLSQSEAARVIAEVLGYFGESVEEFVCRRHRELKAGGLTNEQAFALIAAELPARRVTPPQLSLRQLRRVVYG